MTTTTRPRRRSICCASIVLGVAAMLVGCASTGAGSAVESDDFVDCLADQSDYGDLDPDVDYLDQAEKVDDDQEIEFWSEPAILDCAVRRLDLDERRDALSEAFPEVTGDTSQDLPDGELERQWQAVNVYSTWVYEQDTSTEEALLRAGDLLAALWVADADEPYAANGFSEVAVLATMRADDDLPGFEPYLRTQEQSQDDGDRLILYSQNSLNKIDEAGGDPERYGRFRSLTDAVVDRVRD